MKKQKMKSWKSSLAVLLTVCSACNACSNVTEACQKREKRQAVLSPAFSMNEYPSTEIYNFVKNFATVVGNQPLMEAMTQILNTKAGQASKAATFIYGGALGYTYYRPVYYYVPGYTTFPAYSYYPYGNIYSTASNMAAFNSVIDAIIAALQAAIDQAEEDYYDQATEAS